MDSSERPPLNGVMSTPHILVLGATGKTGRRVAARLRLRGTPVRAASRSSETAFDWSRPDGWDAVLKGVDAAYVVAPDVPGPVHDFVARAESAGVRRLVLLSGRGADSWGDSSFGREMRDAEDAVRGSSLEWSILRPNNFAQNFDEELWYAPLLAGTLALPAGTVGEPFVDADDVADAAAKILTEPGAHGGTVYELTGPRSITFGEAVGMISRASGRSIAYEQISPAAYAEALIGDGVGDDAAHHVAEMFVLMDRGLITAPTDGVTSLLGRAPRTFEDYVLTRAAAGVWTR